MGMGPHAVLMALCNFHNVHMIIISSFNQPHNWISLLTPFTILPYHFDTAFIIEK